MNLFITKYRTSLGYNIFIFHNRFKEEYRVKREYPILKKKRKRLTKRFVAGLSRIYAKVVCLKKKDKVIKCKKSLLKKNRRIYKRLFKEKYYIVKGNLKYVYLKKCKKRKKYDDVIYTKKKMLLIGFFITFL